jgi:antitoxin (DNA-binding transcriptional repressor) of toxin-antitoxin stability system
MKSIDLADVTALTPFVAAGKNEPILVKSQGQPVAAVVPITSADDWEDFVLSRSPEFEAILQESQRSLEEQGGLSTDEVRRRLGLPCP